MHADLSMLWRKEPCFSTHLLKWAMCASSAPDLQLFLRQGKAVKGICPKRTAWAAWSAAAQTALNICVLSADMQTNIAGPLEVESRQCRAMHAEASESQAGKHDHLWQFLP